MNHDNSSNLNTFYSSTNMYHDISEVVWKNVTIYKDQVSFIISDSNTESFIDIDYNKKWQKFIEYLKNMEWFDESDLYLWVKYISIDTIWYFSVIDWIENLTIKEIEKLVSHLEMKLDDFKVVINKLVNVWIDINIGNIIKYFWIFRYLNDKEFEVVSSILKEHKYLLYNKVFIDLISQSSFYDIILWLEDLNKDLNIVNILEYKIQYINPTFNEMKYENTDTPKNYNFWYPDNSINIWDYTKDSFPFIGLDICSEFNSSQNHTFKEQVELTNIIWTVDATMNSWLDRALWWNRDAKKYADLMLKKSSKMLESFDYDPISLLKLKWPNWAFVYIVGDNWNHRIVAWKMANLPFVDAKVSYINFPKNIKLNDKDIDDFQNRINLWIIDWYIENNILYINNILFDWAYLERDSLFKYISVYEMVYPDSFSKIKKILEL